MDCAQVTGATSSYARKYALNGLFAIDDTKDADSHDNSQSQPIKKQESVQLITKEQQKKLVDVDAKNVIEPLLIAKQYKSVAEIPADKYEVVLNYILDRQ